MFQAANQTLRRFANARLCWNQNVSKRLSFIFFLEYTPMAPGDPKFNSVQQKIPEDLLAQLKPRDSRVRPSKNSLTSGGIWQGTVTSMWATQNRWTTCWGHRRRSSQKRVPRGGDFWAGFAAGQELGSWEPKGAPGRHRWCEGNTIETVLYLWSLIPDY